MAKLVVLSEGFTGQSYELKVDKTTVGRVEDNTFQIPHASVSSHHCEILLKGNDVAVKDLNSTNGTFINNNQITGEAVIKPGQILRLGQIEIRLEVAGAAAPKRPVDSTMVISKGVSIEQLEQGPQGFDTTKSVFTTKKNTTNTMFFVIGGVLLVVIIIAILYALSKVSGGAGGTH